MSQQQKEIDLVLRLVGSGFDQIGRKFSRDLYHELQAMRLEAEKLLEKSRATAAIAAAQNSKAGPTADVAPVTPQIDRLGMIAVPRKAFFPSTEEHARLTALLAEIFPFSELSLQFIRKKESDQLLIEVARSRA